MKLNKKMKLVFVLVAVFLAGSLTTDVLSGKNASKPLPRPFFLPAINYPPC